MFFDFEESIMSFKIKTASLLAVMMFLSSAFVASSTLVSNPAISSADDAAIPASTSGLGSRLTPVSILVYNQFSDLFGEFTYTIDAIERTYGPQFEYDNLTDYTKLASKLPGHDIFLITEMELISLQNITTIGPAWSSILQSYVTNGGNVIVLDYVYSPMEGAGARLFNETGLMSVTGIGSHYGQYTPTTLYLVNSSDALGQGLPASYTSTDGTIAIQTTDGTVVVDDGTDAVVVHKIMGKGNIVYLGFDYYSSSADIDTIFGNAIRLHRHIVFDDSHGQAMELQNTLAAFGADLITNRFAVSSIGSFDPDYIAACDVLVITRAATYYTASEVDSIREFVDSGGAVFITTDYGSYGDELDPVLDAFGYMRNQTHVLVDYDDSLGDPGWIPFSGSNLHNHSATLSVSYVEMYAGTGFVELPANAFTLIATDDDGTALFMGGEVANNTPVAAVSTYGMGRVGVFGDGDALDGVANTDGDGSTNYVENSPFLRNMIRWLSAGGIEERKVLFDASHGYNYYVDASYRGFAELLTENGYTIFWMSTFYPSFITGMDALIVEDGSLNYTASEMDTIQAFVADGGGLLLLGGSGDYGLQADVVGGRFGFDLNNTGNLQDTDDYLVNQNYVLYDASNMGSHPILKGVDRLESSYASAFISIGSATSLVKTDNDGTSIWNDGSPANGLTVMAARPYQFGRVVFCGDYRFIRINEDLDGDGIQNLYEQDNSVFILNSLYWLTRNHAPTVQLTYPNGGEVLNGTKTITWNAADVDTDAMRFTLYYSGDGGGNWSVLATSISASSYAWNTSLVDDGTEYLIRVVVSDGSLTGSDQSNDIFTIHNLQETTTTTGGGLPINTTLLLIIGAAAVVVIIVLVVVYAKKGKSK